MPQDAGTEVQEPEEGTPAPEPAPSWASSASIPADDYEDVRLPSAGLMVRVRYLDTPEIVRLSLMPDYAGYITLIQQLMTGAIKEEEWDAGLATEETVAYHALVAHRAVMDPMHDDEIMCMDCGYKHRRSLWTLNQTRRLPANDLEFVTSVALRAVEVVAAGPFSGAIMQSVSDEPATTGESTPQTNSADPAPAS